MGPITLFDKSFIQSLSIDESVWFDHFFTCMVCPVFFTETLADLSKAARAGKTPEDEVKIIADKFPEMHGSPCAFHLDLCLSNLTRNRVPVRRGIPTFSGQAINDSGKLGMMIDVSPEAEAFNRWVDKKFSELEHQQAKIWREQLAEINLTTIAEQFQSLGINPQSCKSLEDAKKLAENIIRGSDKKIERLKLACIMLRVPTFKYAEIIRLWSDIGSPPVSSYAPYAAYVLEVEVFFQIALAAKLISTERASNLIDNAYLSYLPFCDIFVSSDKLHKKCAPLFLKGKQQFIYGPDLKQGLKEVNDHYGSLPDEEKEKGVMSIAKTPPKDGEFYISKIWDHHYSDWRTKKVIENPEDALSPEQVKKILSAGDAPTISKDRIAINHENIESLTIKRKMHKKKGSWYQIPKNTKE